MKVVYKKEADREEQDYQYLCCEELQRLNCFTSWYIDEDSCLKLKLNSVSNKTMVVILGAVQEKLLKIAFFSMGFDDSPLSLELHSGVSWKDVYDILSSIDHIDIGD